MKRLLYITLFLVTTVAFAQDPYLQKSDEELEKIARDLTFEYNKQLALDSKQVPLFEKKVEEFLIREEKIRRSLKGKPMLDAMVKLRLQETGEMANILTQPQLDLYKRVKAELQPLDVVDVEKKKKGR